MDHGMAAPSSTRRHVEEGLRVVPGSGRSSWIGPSQSGSHQSGDSRSGRCSAMLPRSRRRKSTTRRCSTRSSSAQVRRADKLDVLNAKTPDPGESRIRRIPIRRTRIPRVPIRKVRIPRIQTPRIPILRTRIPRIPIPRIRIPRIHCWLIPRSATKISRTRPSPTSMEVHNAGNTTSAYSFRPSCPRPSDDQRYQLIVTRRSMAAGPRRRLHAELQVHQPGAVNIVNLSRPDGQPDPENPDPENPDPENPDPENPDPENPDPENPDPENANFFLAPEETATVTLRVFDLDKNNDNTQGPPQKREDVAAKTAAEAANTGETKVSSAVQGPDLTLFDTPATVSPAISRPGKPANGHLHAEQPRHRLGGRDSAGADTHEGVLLSRPDPGRRRTRWLSRSLSRRRSCIAKIPTT